MSAAAAHALNRPGRSPWGGTPASRRGSHRSSPLDAPRWVILLGLTVLTTRIAAQPWSERSRLPSTGPSHLWFIAPSGEWVRRWLYGVATAVRRGRTMMRGRHPRPFPPLAGWIAAVFLWAATTPVRSLAADASPASAPAPLIKMASRLGVSRVALSRLNENDAMAAYKVLIGELGKKLGYDLDIEIQVFDSLPEFAKAIREKRVTYVITGSWEFVNMQVDDAVDLEFSAVNGERFAHRWRLLVRRDAGFMSVADLSKKRATLLYNEVATLGRPWFETLLLEQHLGDLREFFAACEPVNKPSVAVLPVFFGKADACIVDEASFGVMVEMNPQLGQALVPLAESEPMLDGIIAFTREGWPTPQSRVDMRHAIATLHQEPAGRQLLTLFKYTRLVSFEPAHLESVRRLFQRYRQLQTAPQP